MLKGKSAFWFVCLAFNLFSVPFLFLRGLFCQLGEAFVLSGMSDGGLANSHARDERGRQMWRKWDSGRIGA